MTFPVLHWSYRDLREFPKEVLEAGNSIEEIYLKENFIESLPMWLFDMTNLKFINIQGNRIHDIPIQIGCLLNLEFLDFSKNQIKVIPLSIFKLTRLKCLNLSENEIDYLPPCVGDLKQLEVIDLSRNKLTRVPNELAKCTSLLEVNFSGNPRLYHVPNKVYGLAKMIYLNLDDCALLYLPYIAGSGLVHARVFQNQLLTHIPIMYHVFLQPWMENLPFSIKRGKPRDPLFKVITSDQHWCSLPLGIVTVHKRHVRQPTSLYELTLRKFYTSFWGYILDAYLSQFLPRVVYEYVRAGPIGHCNNLYCVTPLFRECYFNVLQRQHGTAKFTYSAIFCSKECSEMWLWQNSSIYKDIEWSREEEVSESGEGIEEGVLN